MRFFLEERKMKKEVPWHLSIRGTLEEKQASRSRRKGTPASFVGVTLVCLQTEPTGFEPAIFCVTGRHVRPLHHGSLRTGTRCTPHVPLHHSRPPISCQGFLRSECAGPPP